MMNTTKPERNPKTHKAHRREVFWQIVFPLTIGTIIILGLAVWAILAAVNGGNVSQPADTSLIFMLIPTMIITIIPLVAIAGLAYGIIVLNKKLPGYFYQAQNAMNQVRDGVRNAADKLVVPLIRFKSTIAAIEAFRRKE